MSKPSVNTVFFDLDGTLLDTAPDLAFALNSVLKKYGKSDVNLVDFRYHVQGGSESMLQYGLNITHEHPNYPAIRQEFLDIYRGHLAVDTKLFPGMAEVLQLLDQRQIPWGVITNKPGWLTNPLLDSLKLAERACCIVSGDSVPKRKPDPMPLLHACQLSGTRPNYAVYIGDTEDDVIAAKKANMFVIAVRYGYHQKESDPETWNADLLIDTPLELIAWINQHTNKQVHI